MGGATGVTEAGVTAEGAAAVDEDAAAAPIGDRSGCIGPGRRGWCGIVPATAMKPPYRHPFDHHLDPRHFRAGVKARAGGGLAFLVARVALVALVALATSTATQAAPVGAKAPPAPTSTATPTAPARPASSAPGLDARDVRTWKLGNGLKVLFLAKHDAPVATVQIFYHVGSKDEHVGNRGVAHMFEHMMFKGSAHVPPEEHARLLKEVGGQVNAFTTEDVTVYHQTVPPSYVDFALELEAERMRNLRLFPSTVDSERKVVEEEKRLRIDNNPVGQAIEAFRALAYTIHPYRWTAAGTLEDLDRVTPADCQAFYDTFYRPNNATLVVVGDLDELAVRASVERHFGGLAAGPPVPRAYPIEPAQSTARTTTLVRDVNLPVIATGFHIPAASHPDVPALEVLATILSTGESSRLNQRLVRHDKLAVAAGGVAEVMEHPGLFIVYAAHLPSPEPGRAQGRIRAALLDEVARVRTQRVGAAELAKARNQLSAGHVFGLESCEGIARELGMAELVRGDWHRFLDATRAYARVTADDVERVARTYLVESNSTTVMLRAPEPSAEGAAAPAPAPASTSTPTPTSAPAAPAGARAAAAGDAAARFWSGRSDLIAAPAPPQAVELALPPVARSTLPNGLELLMVPRTSLPIVSVSVAIKAGDFDESRDVNQGAADFTAAMLRKGTRGRTADDISRTIDSVGGALDAASGPEHSVLTCSVLAKDADLCVQLLADLLVRPTFPLGEMPEIRDQMLAALAARADDPHELASEQLDSMIFGPDHPAGWFLLPRHVQKLSRDDLQRFWETYYRPNNAIVAVAGAVDVGTMKAHLARAFAGWKAAAIPPRADPRIPEARGAHVLLVDKPDLTQATLLLGHVGIRHADPVWYAATLVNYVLGGSDFSSRLMTEVRTKRGLTYGVGSSFGESLTTGAFRVSAATRNASAVEALRISVDEIRRMQAEGPTATELAKAKGYFAGSTPLALESAAGLSSALVAAELHGLPSNYVAHLAWSLAAVTADEARAAARRLLRPDALSVVMIGRAEVIRPELDRAHIQYGQVDYHSLPLTVSLH
jgi:zinc protease